MAQSKYFTQIIETGKQFYNDPGAAFYSWSIKQRISFLCASSLISLYILYRIKSSYNQHKLRQNGYRLADLTSQAWELCQQLGASPTVCGFEISSDKFTYQHLKDFIKHLMKSFINFRSQIYKINGRWYFKEEFDPNTEDMSKYATYIPMECNNINANDTSNIIEEKLLQETLKYLNDNNGFNVKWNTYKRAHIDAYYFHFKSHNKCIIYLRFNHSYADGILVSTLVALVQHQLYDPKYKHLNINYEQQNDNIIPLITDILGNKIRSNYSIWNTIYYYMHYPIAWMTVWIHLLTNKSDKQSVFRGKFEGNNKLAIGRPIDVQKFKSIAKKHNGTVNDLFNAISIGSLRRYAEKYKCPSFNDENFNGIYTGIGVVNRRPLSPVNVKQASVAEAQRSFSQIKYGYTPTAFRTLSDFVLSIPFALKLVFNEKEGAKTTFCTSNIKGPATLLPIPSSAELDDDNDDVVMSHENECVSWLFGMAVPAMLPMSFTLLTYKNHIRVGILTDCGSVKDPNALMQCFVDEWNEYNA